ncbi:hypothetical protein [Tahibacter amnicola]|uniref:Uncharacterized protein n=1 Tax=Tahibacter amnicola TaxID=2976241 RepID=A0ABY6B913_9GAMM|nr:hypothetical protein [Tahibacter amnicola]UXI66359.1 hypothetical protein N4264_16570 [Tahibacter amnicola]
MSELMMLRRQLTKELEQGAKYRVGNEIFKRANALWRDGLLTPADYMLIRDEVDSMTATSSLST